MRRKILNALCVFLLTVPAIRARWMVTDPGNLAQDIVDSVSEMVETSETAQNAMSTFEEALEIYKQSRKYYDMLKSVNSLMDGSLKVKESALMLSEISESYVTNYGKMLTDESYAQRKLEVIAFSYNNTMEKSSVSVAELKDIINPTGTSAVDKERLGLIERVYHEIRHYRTLVSYYTHKNLRVSYLWAREKGKTKQVLEFYGEDERY